MAVAREQILRAFIGQHDQLRGYLYSLLADNDLADEAMQELFLVVDRRWRQFEQGRDLGAWFRGCARNVAKQTRRRPGSARVQVDSELLQRIEAAYEAWPAVEAERFSDGLRRSLERCVAGLEQRQQQLIRWHFGEGLSHSAIGERLTRTAAAVQMALARIRKALHECIRIRMVRDDG